MITSTLRDARVRLNELVRRAVAGEEVVLFKGSKPVVSLTPISSSDLELSPRVTDAQAARLWEWSDRERREGRMKTFRSSRSAVEALKRTLKATRRG